MSELPTPRPLYLSGTEDPIFGIFHAVDRGPRRSTAVLICPPFGWEDVCSYRSRRAWGIHLARAGYPALRLDLPGTGDSGGSPREPERLAAWIEATGAAATWLRAASGCGRLAVVGIGLGGLVTCGAIAAGSAIDEVVLWATPSLGQRLVRELRTFARLQKGVPMPEQVARADGLPADDSTAAGGFVLTAETAAALERFDVAQLPMQPGQLRRALLLGRDGSEVDAPLLSWLEELGTAVSVAGGEGYAAMMAEPEQARPPTTVFARVEDWLADAPSGASVPQASASRSPSTRASDGKALDTVELVVQGTRMRESLLSVDQSFGRLFGILTEPVGVPSADLCAVMLNAGAIRRIGPNRMWVELARRWAARGVSTLRLDIESLGDADGDADRFAKVGAFCDLELVDQVRAALDVLQASGHRRFVLGGLCSGAYWSFHAALRDERVVAAFMLNPRVMFWDSSLVVARGVRRGLLRPSSWAKVLRGDVPRAKVIALVAQAPAALAGVPRRLRDRSRERHVGGDELDRALDQLREADKQILFAFSENEPLQEELERDGRWERREEWPNVTFESIPGSDHALRPLESQRCAHAALDRALERQLERSRPRVPVSSSDLVAPAAIGVSAMVGDPLSMGERPRRSARSRSDDGVGDGRPGTWRS